MFASTSLDRSKRKGISLASKEVAILNEVNRSASSAKELMEEEKPACESCVCCGGCICCDCWAYCACCIYCVCSIRCFYCIQCFYCSCGICFNCRICCNCCISCYCCVCCVCSGTCASTQREPRYQLGTESGRYMDPSTTSTMELLELIPKKICISSQLFLCT